MVSEGGPIYLRKVALKEANLMLKCWVRSIGAAALHGEVVEQIAGPEVGRGLGDELSAFHSLTIPVGSAVNGHFDAAQLRGHCRVLIVR